jgi:hypothetical protein
MIPVLCRWMPGENVKKAAQLCRNVPKISNSCEVKNKWTFRHVERSTRRSFSIKFDLWRSDLYQGIQLLVQELYRNGIR